MIIVQFNVYFQIDILLSLENGFATFLLLTQIGLPIVFFSLSDLKLFI
jgi:hypothetical protein